MSFLGHFNRCSAASRAAPRVALAVLAGCAGAEPITGGLPPPPQGVDAGVDQTIAFGTPAALNATVSLSGAGPVRMFWTRISGPGKVNLATEQFNSSFDDPTFTDWIGPNPVVPANTGALQGDEGNWVDVNYATLTTERVRSGTAWKARTPLDWQHSAKLLRWRFDRTESYFGVWFWWPTDQVVNGHGTGGFTNYLNLMQWKERTSPWNPTWVIGVSGKPGTTDRDEFIIHDWYNSQPIVHTGVEIPKGQWVHLMAYMREGFGTSGALAAWLTTSPDNEATWQTRLLYAQSGINTLGGATNISPAHLMWGISNYSDALVGQGLETIYYDDVTVSPVDAGNILTTTATFPARGTYVLRLTAWDGTQTQSDNLTITVQ